MAFEIGTKLYCNSDSPITTIDGGEIKNVIPFEQEGRNSQNYYGESSGGPNQEDIYWQPGDVMGVTTGRTAIKDATLYYEFSMKSSYRTRNRSIFSYVPIVAIFGGIDNAGTYQDITRSAWVSSQFCTNSKANALSKFDKRTDKATLSQVQNEQKAPADLGGSGGDKTPAPETKSNTGLIVGLSALGLLILGGLTYFFTRNR